MVMATCAMDTGASRRGFGIRQMLQGVRRRQERRRAARQLMRLDDHLLRDINLTRGDALAMLENPDAGC